MERKVFEGWWKKFFYHADFGNSEFENNMIIYDGDDSDYGFFNKTFKPVLLLSGKSQIWSNVCDRFDWFYNICAHKQ